METIAFLQSFASPALDRVVQAIADLGSANAYIVFLLVVYLAIDAEAGRRAAALLLGSFYLNFHLKGWFDTPRPFEIDPALKRSAETDLGPGFPSGHAQAATSFWGYLALRFHRAWLWLLVGLLIPLIALSRLYLGLHLPIDVVGGVLIGAALIGGLYLIADPLEALARTPWALRFGLGLGIPLALHLVLPAPGAQAPLLMGGMAAFLTAPMLLRHRPHGALWRRAALVLLGAVMVFALLAVSSAVLPELVKRHPLGGFARYLLIGWAGVVAAPWLARRIGLASAGGRNPAA